MIYTNDQLKTLNKNYKESIPIKKSVDIINSLYFKDYYIKIFTARGIDYLKKIKSKLKTIIIFTLSQLKKWKVNYHELNFI